MVWRRLEREREYLVDAEYRVEGHRLADVVGDVVKVGPVALRDDHLGQAGRVGGQDLLLQSADREHAALQRYLAGHADRVLDRAPRQQRRERGGHRDPRTRAVLRDRPGRHVHVEGLAVEVDVPDVELIAVGSDPGECDLGRLLHHVAELPRENELAVAVHPGGLNEEHVAARTRHGEPGRDAGNGGSLGRLLPEALSAEPVAGGLELDRPRSLAVAGGDPGRGLPQQLAELPLELPDPRLARVLAHDRLDQLVRDLDLVLAQTIALDLPRPEVAARARDLL